MISTRYQSDKKIKAVLRHDIFARCLSLRWVCYISVLMLLNWHRLVQHIYTFSRESYIHRRCFIFYRNCLNFYIGQVSLLNYFYRVSKISYFFLPTRPVYFVYRPRRTVKKLLTFFRFCLQLILIKLRLSIQIVLKEPILNFYRNFVF